eukprot:TRINITY_DN1497_c0_g1_i1.p1 TRINITY_DN1497_c0_g1~~TRINITY_DN1497_c0_g1_i1.p1  ORF type:complete len:121 (-),score=22.63 TRINITY_DN1497_c0_g1_i1:101-463(-)
MFDALHIKLNKLHKDLVDNLTTMTGPNLRRLNDEIEKTSKDSMEIDKIKVTIEELYSLVRNDLIVSITEMDVLIKTDLKKLENVEKIMKTLDSEFKELDGVMLMNRADWRKHKTDNQKRI